MTNVRWTIVMHSGLIVCVLMSKLLRRLVKLRDGFEMLELVVELRWAEQQKD